MDIGTLAGFIFAMIFIIVSILLGGVLSAFIDLPSVMITIGGSIAASFIAYPPKDALTAIRCIGFAFKSTKLDAIENINILIELSNTARKEGLLSLEEKSDSIENDIMKKGIILMVIGTDPSIIKGVLETEILCMAARHKRVYGYWEKLGSLAPAWGMIGTLVGLINMLRNLSDPTTIGPSMAVALITTFYGSLIANLIALPVASKLKINSAEEVAMNEMIMEGVLCIQAGENPKVIEDKLQSYLAPKTRLTKDSMKDGE